MCELSEKIIAQARAQPEGVPVTTKDLLYLGNREEVNQALLWLTRRGVLLYAGQDAYVLSIESRFGKRAPAIEKIVMALAEQRGERIVTSGAMAANTLGLTTQVPIRLVYLTSGRSQQLIFGKQKVELRHAPNWQLVLGNSKSGQMVRALAWLGPEKSEAVASRLNTLLSYEEQKELVCIMNCMPDWLAKIINRIVHDCQAKNKLFSC